MIIGIDEVGRGCWAGPLVAAAVGFNSNPDIVGLTDSKLLSAKKRSEISLQIEQLTEHIGIGWVWPEEINKIGLTESVRLAMQRAFDQIEGLARKVVIDGSINYLPHVSNTEAVIKADGTVAAVSAASIIAKVARDTYMTQMAETYPEYAFEKHVGYGTKLHMTALETYGVTPLHRLNYKPVQRYL